MREIWRDIYYTDSITGELIDYRGLYQVSNFGRVKSLTNTKSRNQYKCEQILTIQTKERYSRIGLSKNGKLRRFRVHRLVAHMFIPNPNKYPVVNHIEEHDKHNNKVDNLEWCNHSHNVNHGTRNQRVAEKLSIPVVSVDKYGNTQTYKSMRDAENAGYNASHIGECCRGYRKTHMGYKWYFLSNFDMAIMSEADESQ